MDRRSWLGIGTALLGLLFFGCEAEPARPVPVHGKVFYKNVPLPGGIIVFTPDAARGGDGPMAHAEIQADGSYTLRSDCGAGAMPGWHRVTITSVGEGNTHLPIPARYGDPEQSGLSFEVKAGRDNVIDINLP
jgi:hypothetical protein